MDERHVVERNIGSIGIFCIVVALASGVFADSCGISPSQKVYVVASSSVMYIGSIRAIHGTVMGFPGNRNS
jgi:hypothetical protein